MAGGKKREAIMDNPAKRYVIPDAEPEQKKNELEKKLISLFRQFFDETGLPVDLVIPDYIESTAVADDLRRYPVIGVNIQMGDPKSVIMER